MTTSDPQDRAEQLDDDKTGTELPADVIDIPPDEPLGVDEYGTTPAEERIPESLEERVQREEPEE